MTRKQWCEILLALCKHLDINKFHLLGYSMGGRVAMTTAELLPQLTRSLFVLAPDGFYKNPIYLFASGTAPGRWLYRKMIYYPAPLFLLANVLHKLGLLSSKLHRFIHVHLDTPHKRMQVYRTWLLYRKMFPVLPNLALLIRQKQFDFHMIFGRYDSVITVRRGKKFCRILGSSDAMHVLDQGHRLLNEDTVKYINSNELWPGLQRQS